MGCAKTKTRHWPGYGGWVRAGRESRGLTEAQLGEKVGLPAGRIREMERSPRPPKEGWRKAVERALNFPPHFFTRETPEDHDGGWVCGEGVEPCAAPGNEGSCGYAADYLCDWPTGEGKTCDLPLCEDHAVEHGPEWQDMHFCPQHRLAGSPEAS